MAHFFCIFHALSFELNLFCDQSLPLTVYLSIFSLCNLLFI